MPAVLFGSIGTLADASELQRSAFNDAFEQHGLDWKWSREEYQDLLQGSGGSKRIADFAEARGEEVDADAVHTTKSELFRSKLTESGAEARPGVIKAVEEARENGFKVAFVTTTSKENVAAVGDALGPDLDVSAFDLVVDTTDVDDPKPDPAAYAYALEQLGEDADSCVAIEDNVGGVESAAAAGVACIAFPNANTSGHDFGNATSTVEELDFATLREATSS